MTSFTPRTEVPVVKAHALAHLRLTRRDLAKAERYFIDFGLHVAARTERAVYLRGLLPQHHCVIIERGEHDRFKALGIAVGSETDLYALAATRGGQVELSTEPGAGQVLRLVDPAGFAVEVMYGVAALPELRQREPRLANLPLDKRRINTPQPTLIGPAEVYRLGHAVMTRQEFAKNANWYVETFGMIASDVEVLDTREPVLAFLRFDQGAVPSDHHSIVVAAGPDDGYGHAAFETLDIDSLGTGAEWLQQRGWVKSWGIGRHVLGSQMFCYHLDSSGFEVEHYADGDVFDADVPTRYHEAGVSGLYLWGPELPQHFIDVEMNPARLARVIGGLRTREDFSLPQLMAMKKAYTARPRPWSGKPFRKPRAE